MSAVLVHDDRTFANSWL